MKTLSSMWSFIFSVSSEFPVYWGLCNLNPHIMCLFLRKNFPSGIMGKFLKKGGVCDELIVDPFNPLDAKMKILSKISEFPHGSRLVLT